MLPPADVPNISQIGRTGRAHDVGVFVLASTEPHTPQRALELNRQIAPPLYRAIAELLGWLYSIDSAQTNGRLASAVPHVARPTK